MNPLSTNLKTLLTNAALSENELARRTGVSQQIINRLLSGENTNPKIATLTPLANYFMVSISQLIGDQTAPIAPVGWKEVPLLDWSALSTTPIETLLTQKHDMILVDIASNRRRFATYMTGHAMAPTFSEGTILIFDVNKEAQHDDFVLLQTTKQELMVRQWVLKENTPYYKSLNPTELDYYPTELTSDHKRIGTLVQSRTNYIR